MSLQFACVRACGLASWIFTCLASNWPPCTRTNMRLLVRPPLEVAEELFYDMDETEERVKLDKELEALYESHPVLQQKEEHETFEPVGLYFDKTPYSNKRSYHGIFMNSLRRGSRHLLAITDADDFCDCSCRGWGSIAALQFSFCWSFNASAAGFWPSSRHDNKPWKPEDTWRARRTDRP